MSRSASSATARSCSPRAPAMTLGRPVAEARPAQLRELAPPLVPGARQPDLREDLRAAPADAGPSGSWGSTSSDGEDAGGPVNGVVIELTEAELDRLDLREIRYDRADVTGLGRRRGPARADRHLHRQGRATSRPSRRRTRSSSATYANASSRPSRPSATGELDALPGHHRPLSRRARRGDPGHGPDPRRQPASLVAAATPGASGGPSP